MLQYEMASQAEFSLFYLTPNKLHFQQPRSRSDFHYKMGHLITLGYTVIYTYASPCTSRMDRLFSTGSKAKAVTNISMALIQ
jgi:hypothetical protein